MEWDNDGNDGQKKVNKDARIVGENNKFVKEGEGNEKEDFKSWLTSSVGRVSIITGAVILVIVVILTVLSIKSVIRGMDSGSEWEYTEYDPASDTMIVWMSSTSDESGGPRYVGTEILIDNGMTEQQYRLFKEAIESYAREKGIELTRISYLKDSYKLATSYVFDFRVVLNVDQETLKVRLDSSVGWKDIMGAKVYLWDENGKELKTIEVTEDNICEYVGDVECGYDGT